MSKTIKRANCLLLLIKKNIILKVFSQIVDINNDFIIKIITYYNKSVSEEIERYYSKHQI